ncbi:ATPase associated with various cellular activities family protein [Mycobacterium xenopi 3993]|nr:ATPase associated with various cellular activities family protein [Mycobacterium xenopi 3993]
MLEDLDLIVGDRRKSSDTRALSEFLAVMDTDPSAPILTLASTNDVMALDAASIRTARFDSIVEIGYPDRDAAAKILSTYLRGVPAARASTCEPWRPASAARSVERISARSCAALSLPAVRSPKPG